jgi:hypothetical protein
MTNQTKARRKRLLMLVEAVEAYSECIREMMEKDDFASARKTAGYMASCVGKIERIILSEVAAKAQREVKP